MKGASKLNLVGHAIWVLVGVAGVLLTGWGAGPLALIWYVAYYYRTNRQA